jgi:two-component system chemotaxis response regulator CheY
MKLLIVDDSLVVRNAIERSGTHDQITEILRAADGAEAVEIFSRQRPELVTMDLTMPRLDGLAAIEQIRAIDPHASILVVSALNSYKTALDAIRRGACGFLTKPFTDQEVVDAIDELIAHAEGQRADAEH